jgi:hypothetical protein
MRLEEAKKHLREIEQLMAAADDLRAMFPDPATMSKEIRWYLAKVDKYLSGEADSLHDAIGLYHYPGLPTLDEVVGLPTKALNSDPPAAPRRRRAGQKNLPRL